MNVVLTGFMASGKTTIGRAFAELTGYRFEDTDSIIVTKTGMEINDIFQKYGEAHFRALEREAVREAASADHTVIATGGGAVLDKSNVDALRENGVIINLEPDFEVIEERALKARASRPLMRQDSLADIKKRFNTRKPFYDNCDYKLHITKGRSAHSYALEIIDILKNEE